VAAEFHIHRYPARARARAREREREREVTPCRKPRVPATGWEPLTAKLISLKETVETNNEEVHHSSLISLINELAHGLAVPEQVRMIEANVLHC